MSENLSFAELMHRTRAGDEDAAAELVRRYEPAIRRVVHVRLVDVRLRRVFDSLDICQSVLGSFFVRAALGQYELDSPDQLLKLLVTMACNKLAGRAHQERAACRDHRRLEPGGLDAGEIHAAEASPSQQVAAKEVIQKVRERLSEEELQLADWRAEGREWADIAAEVGGSPEALRKKLTRAIERAARAVGLDEEPHG